MKPYLARYTLHNGHRGVLTVIAASSWAAIELVFATFPEQVRGCAARPLSHPRPRSLPCT